MKRRLSPVIALSFIMLGSAGCNLFLDGNIPLECDEHMDCLEGEYCAQGVCVLEGERPIPIVDSTAPPHDANATAFDAADTPLSDDADILDAMVGDVMAPDMMPAETPPFPDGLCFEGHTGVVFRPEPPSNFIPSGHCSPWARGWVYRDGQHKRLRLERGPETNVITIDIADTPRFRDRTLVVTRQNVVESSANVWIMDLAALDDGRSASTPGTPDDASIDIESAGLYISPSSYRQSNPQPGRDYVAFEEQSSTGRGRVIVVKNDLKTDCGREQFHQWGLVAGDDWIAFFEQGINALRPRLTIVPADDCANPSRRRQRLLSHVAASNQPLTTVGHSLFWLEMPGTGSNELWRWDHTVPGAEPHTVSEWFEDENPIEIGTSETHLAVVTFRGIAPRFALYVIAISTGERHLINTSQDVRQPHILDPYLLWSEGSGQRGWEARYERLD